MLGLVRTIGLVVIAIVAMFFFIQNLATIEVAFFTWSFSAPRAVIFVMVFGLGLIAGYLLHALRPRPRAALREVSGANVREQERPEASNTRE